MVIHKTTKYSARCPLLAVAIALMIVFLSSDLQAHGGKPDPKLALRLDMNRFWAAEVIWTRAYMLAALAKSPEAPQVRERLLRNQEEIGQEFGFFYGLERSKKLTGILKSHALLASETIEAACSGDEGRLQEAQQKWLNKMGEIAAFLNQVNPEWSKEQLMGLLKEHVVLAMKELKARQKQDWKEDIQTLDRHLSWATVIADILTAGIVKQLPAKF